MVTIWINRKGRLFILPSHYPSYHGWVFVGTFSLLYLDGEADYHIGYGLIPSAWGKGYGAELVQYGTAIFFARTAELLSTGRCRPAVGEMACISGG